MPEADGKAGNPAVAQTSPAIWRKCQRHGATRCVVGPRPQRDLHQPTFDVDRRALIIEARVVINIVEQSVPCWLSRLLCSPARVAPPNPCDRAGDRAVVGLSLSR